MCYLTWLACQHSIVPKRGVMQSIMGCLYSHKIYLLITQILIICMQTCFFSHCTGPGCISTLEMMSTLNESISPCKSIKLFGYFASRCKDLLRTDICPRRMGCYVHTALKSLRIAASIMTLNTAGACVQLRCMGQVEVLQPHCAEQALGQLLLCNQAPFMSPSPQN